MSYKLYTPHNRPAHQWDNRTLDDEVRVVSERPLLGVFRRNITMPGACVLEAGCGLGAFCVWFLRNGCKVVGLENQPSVVERAHQEMVDIPVQMGDIADIQFPDESFDAYISLGVIEHFEDGPSDVLREALRVLRPGGVAIITVPANTVMRRLLSHRVRDFYFWLNSFRGREKHFGEYRFSMSELKRLATQAGFEVMEEGVDDYAPTDPRKNIGLYTDWPFFRDRAGEMWSLNLFGRLTMKILRLVTSEKTFCAGWYIVGRKV